MPLLVEQNRWKGIDRARSGDFIINHEEDLRVKTIEDDCVLACVYTIVLPL